MRWLTNAYGNASVHLTSMHVASSIAEPENSLSLTWNAFMYDLACDKPRVSFDFQLCLLFSVNQIEAQMIKWINDINGRFACWEAVSYEKQRNFFVFLKMAARFCFICWFRDPDNSFDFSWRWNFF